MQFNQLKESLYQSYYNDDSTSSNFSDVTSSHWRDFGEKQLLLMEGKTLKLMRTVFQVLARKHFLVT